MTSLFDDVQSHADTTAKPEPKMPDFWAMWAVEREACPEGWNIVAWTSAKKDCPDGFVRLEGAVMPQKPSGMPIWRKRVRGTEKTFFVRLADFEEWKKQKADAAGVCVTCWGNGMVWDGWSKDKGNRYKACPACSVPPTTPSGHQNGATLD